MLLNFGSIFLKLEKTLQNFAEITYINFKPFGWVILRCYRWEDEQTDGRTRQRL